MILHRGPISGVAATAQWIATAGYDNQVILWNPETAQAVARASHDHLANQVSFSPCGNYLASASSDFTARVWSVPEMKLISVLGHHQDDVEAVLFHPQKPVIATACRDQKARLFSFEGGLLQTFIGHTADVISIEWSQDGTQLITTSDDGTVKCWDMDTGMMLRQVDMQGVETDTIVVLKNGEICAGNDKGEIVIISQEERRSFCAHRAGIKRLKYDSQRRLLASLSYDRTLKLWREEGLQLIQVSETTLPAAVWPRSAAFFGGSSLVLSTFGTSYATYHYGTGEWSTEKVAPTIGLNAVAILGGDVFTVGDAGVVFKNDIPHLDLGSLCNFLTPFAGVLLAGGQQGVIFDALQGRKIYTHHSPLNCATVFKRGTQLKAIIGTYSGEGIVLGLDENHLPQFETVIPLHQNAIKGLSSSGKHLFSVCATGALAVHSIESFAAVIQSERAHDKIANGCVWLGEECFASISRDLKLRLWDLKRRSHETLVTPHTRSIKCVAATPDGRYIATGSYYGRVCIYDTETKEWILDQRPSCSGISSLTFNGKDFLASSYDGSLYPIPLEGVAP